VQPTPDRFGILAFPNGTSVFSRFVQQQDGRYTLNVNVANEQLEPGTTYYYIINVFNDDQREPKRKREQETGAISTFFQKVKIVWETILITDDADDGGAGEISVWFWINYGKPGAQGFVLNRLGNNSAYTGQAFSIDREITLENAPNDLTLSVSGVEDDTSDFRIFGGVARGDGLAPPVEGPAKTSDFEYNVASASFDLTLYPTGLGETRPEFKLVSMPNGRLLGNLSFVVSGHLEITRSAQ
jgi:hypothetical protein